MLEYKMVQLSQICSVISGSTPKTDVTEFWKGPLKWVTPAELHDNTKIIYDTVRHISPEAVKSAHLQLLPKGTILFSSRAPIGKVAIAGEEMYCNQGFKNLVCSKEINNEYLYFYLKYKSNYIKTLGRGATFKEVSKDQISNLWIKLPDLGTQVNIVKQLNLLDVIIQAKQQQTLYLNQLIQSRFIEMFGSLSQSAYQTLESICELITDGTHQSPQFIDQGIPFLFVSNISDNKIDYRSDKHISSDTFNVLNKRTPIKVGDLILSIVGSYGHCAVIESDSPFSFQRHIAYLKPCRELIDSHYLKSAILSDDVQVQIDRRVKGIAQKTLNLAELKKIIIPVPPLDNQKEFATLVKKIEKSKLAIQQSIDELETLKKSLMQEYFG